MSGASSDIARTEAQAIDARAAAWLDRRDRGAWTDADQSALDAWLEENPVHRVAYWRIEAAWTRTERLAALRSSEIAGTQNRAANRVLPVLVRTAAAVAAIAAIGGALFMFLPDRTDQTFKTAVGERETVKLADGTQIELNTDTLLRARVTAGDRKVWLDRGEAFFQVRHDAAHPFVVVAGDRRLTDLGTKFIVRSDAERLNVAVMDGSVRLDVSPSTAGQKSFVLKRDDAAIASAGSVDLMKMSDRGLDNAAAWRRGVLVFDHTELSSAADELNRYNTTKIVIADSHVGRLRIDGVFPTNDVNAIANIAQEVFRLHVEHRGQEIVISR